MRAGDDLQHEQRAAAEEREHLAERAGAAGHRRWRSVPSGWFAGSAKAARTLAESATGDTAVRCRPPARLAACFAIGAVAGTLLDGHPPAGRRPLLRDRGVRRVGLVRAARVRARRASRRASRSRAIERAVGPPAFPRASSVARPGRRSCCCSRPPYGATALWDGDGAPWLRPACSCCSPCACGRAGAAATGPMRCRRRCSARSPRSRSSATGAFDYAHPDFAGIPMWLPALWANGGLLIRRLLAPAGPTGPGGARARRARRRRRCRRGRASPARSCC